METATIAISARIAGRERLVSLTRQADGATIRSPSLAAAIAAESWTKTDANTGTAVLPAGHGLITGDVVAVFWAGGYRYGLTATVTVNSAVLDGGAGDDLPATDTEVIVAKRQPVEIECDGDDVEVLEADGTYRWLLVLHDAVDAALLVVDLAAGETCLWFTDGGLENPLDGVEVAGAWLFNGVAAVNDVCLMVLEDTTP